MKKVYYLSSCTTCKKIIQNLGLAGSFELQDIKTNKITDEELEFLIKLTGSADKLFSKRSRKYAQLNKKLEEMDDNEIREHILNEYTFLKRPVVVVDREVFIGSSKAEVEKLANTLKP